MSGDGEKKRGRVAFAVTDEARALVRGMAGKPPQAIAAAVGCSVPTLRKYFAAELRGEAGPTLFVLPPAAPRPRGRSGGRRRYEPGPRERGEAALLAAANVGIGAIARRFGVSEPTARRVFAREIAAAYEITRAELLADMRRAAAKGNVNAQAKLIELIDRAHLDRVEEEIGAPEPGQQATHGLGKKEQQARAAEAVMTNSEWSDLLSPDLERDARLN